ncbi:MAG: rhomboid family intramembrane serine protease [Pseudomonadota bacterium]
MFLPLYDVDNKVTRIPWPFVTHAIIALNIVVFLIVNGMPADSGAGTVAWLSYRPDGIPPSAANLPVPGLDLPVFVGAVTSLFLHHDFMHILGNMLFLWVFGDNVEDAFGHLRFLAFFLICGVIACVAQDLMTEPGYIFYGASGATSGIVAAYLMLHPHVRLWVLVLFRIPLRIPAFVVLGFWVLFQIFNALTDVDGAVAWYAHLGGFAVGALLTPFLKKPGVPLFDRGVKLR